MLHEQLSRVSQSQDGKWTRSRIGTKISLHSSTTPSNDKMINDRLLLKRTCFDIMPILTLGSPPKKNYSLAALSNPITVNYLGPIPITQQLDKSLVIHKTLLHSQMHITNSQSTSSLGQCRQSGNVALSLLGTVVYDVGSCVISSNDPNMSTPFHSQAYFCEGLLLGIVMSIWAN